MENLGEVFGVSVLSGGLALGIAYFMGYSDYKVKFLGMDNMNGALVLGGVTLLGTLGGQIASNYILPMVIKNQKEQMWLASAIKLLSTGAVTYLAFNMLIEGNNKALTPMYSATLSTGSNFAGAMLYYSWMTK